MLLGLREGLRRHPRSATERYSRRPDRAATEWRQGHAIKKRLKLLLTVLVILIDKFFFFVIIVQNRDSFLEQQVIGVNDAFALFGFQKYMKGMNVFYLGHDGEIFVMNADDVPNFDSERKEQYYSRSNIAQNRPLGKQGCTHNGYNRRNGNENILGLYPPNDDKGNGCQDCREQVHVFDHQIGSVFNAMIGFGKAPYTTAYDDSKQDYYKQ